MKTKICNHCNIEFPSTIKFFFKKIVKQKLANGTTATYNSFKHICKKCWSINQTNKRRIKRCKEMNCKIEDYKKNYLDQYSRTRSRYPEIRHLRESIRTSIRKWIDNGYKYTTYEQYRLDVKKLHSRRRRKYDYGDCNFVSKENLSRSAIVNLTDAYIALTLNCKVKEVPKDMIETKRLVLKLKRELKLTNYEN